MAGNKRSNKSRNQTTGKTRHQDDAPWHKKNRSRSKARNNQAKRSRRANRGK